MRCIFALMTQRTTKSGSLRSLLGFRLGSHLLSPDHVRAGIERRSDDWREQRRRDLLLADFDAEFYRTAYGDLTHLSERELAGHWLGGGADEGRVASFAQLTREHPEADWSRFSPESFLEANPDIYEMSDATAAIYFARYGSPEGRPVRVNEAPPGLIRAVAEQVLGPDFPPASTTSWRNLFIAIDEAVDTGFAPEIESILEEPDDRTMIIRLVEAIHERVPSPAEVAFWSSMIHRRGRPFVVTSVVRFLARDQESVRRRTGDETWETGIPARDETIHVLGDHASVISFRDWRGRRTAYGASRAPSEDVCSSVVPGEEPAVSVICSLYRGGAFIEPYLENITGQVGFEAHELVIVDADSPEGEEQVIRACGEQFPNIRYLRQAERIGIYEAWNIGIEASRGRYLTNANLDDARHARSLDDMAAFLDEHPEIDVVYTDILYTLEPHADWALLEHVGVRSHLPAITTWNLLEFNSPHCAPMWRRELHDELGGFDASFRSAGDWEFWLRCAEAGKRFHKLPDPLIAYYLNPEGLSTSADTAGIREQWPIRERYRDLLVQPERVLDPLRVGDEHRG
jgi:GT2 family glycosyltransferase